MAEQLIPIPGRLVVEEEKLPEKSEGGIILPFDSQGSNRPLRGAVIAIGANTRDLYGVEIKSDLKIGDKIVFGKYAGTRINCGEDEYLTMNFQEVMGTVVDAPDIDPANPDKRRWGVFIK